MALIGTIQGGTNVINLDYTPQYIAFGAVPSGTGGFLPNITNFSVSVAGREIININNPNFVTAYGYWLMTIPTIGTGSLPTGAEYTNQVLFVSNGNLPNQQTQIRITTDLVAPEQADVYGFSTEFGSDVVLGATNSINANANALVSDFDLLLFDSTNFQSADITFVNGFNDRYELADIANLLCLSGQFNAQGFLVYNPVSLTAIYALNNLSLYNERIASVRLYASGGGILNFATFKTPK